MKCHIEGNGTHTKHTLGLEMCQNVVFLKKVFSHFSCDQATNLYLLTTVDSFCFTLCMCIILVFFFLCFLLIYSDAPLDLKIKASMIADMFSLVGECVLKQ